MHREPENIMKARDEQKTLRQKSRDILNAAETESRALSQAERGTLDRMSRQLEALSDELREYDAAAPAMDWPGSTTGGLPLAVQKQRASGAGTPGRTWADMFGTPKAGPFATDEDFFKAVHLSATKGITDPSLTILGAMDESVGSEGGFSVPAPMAAEWLDKSLESEVVRPRATVYPVIAGDGIKIAGWDDPTHSAGSIAGFTTRWAAELSTEVSSTGKLRLFNLRLNKCMCSTQVSNELLADGQNFEQQLGRKLPLVVGWALDDRFISGSGAGQPLGILSDPTLITITKEASQPANTFVLENALKMYERMWPGGYANAVWIINHSVVPQLFTMVIKVKNVAGAENVGGSLAPYFTVDANGGMKLLNLPVVVTEKNPALSSKGDVILADLSQYAVALKSEITVEASRHAGWSSDSTFYRAVVRVNGAGTWKDVQTPKAGSTRSWAITVEAR